MMELKVGSGSSVYQQAPLAGFKVKRLRTNWVIQSLDGRARDHGPLSLPHLASGPCGPCDGV